MSEACFAGEGDLGDGDMVALFLCREVLKVLLTLLLGVKPKPPNEVRDAGFVLAGTCLAGDRGRLDSLARFPSLVLGLLLPLVPFRLKLELGRGGGGIGLSIGEKKLDRRRSLGVDGRF